MDSIVGFPVIVSARYRIVINSKFRNKFHIPKTGRVKLLTCKNYLQIFPDFDFIPNAREKEISAGRFNLPMDWTRKNHMKIGDHVFLIAASDCILVCPSVSQQISSGREQCGEHRENNRIPD